MTVMTVKMSNMDVTFIYDDVWNREDQNFLFILFISHHW